MCREVGQEEEPSCRGLQSETEKQRKTEVSIRNQPARGGLRVDRLPKAIKQKTNVDIAHFAASLRLC